MKNKIGRNDLCPCGSGIKYKKCHGYSKTSGIPIKKHIIPELLNTKSTQNEISNKLGKIRPSISFNTRDYKFVAVGNQLHYAKKDKWQTFHDFLFDYIKHCLSSDWGNRELKKVYNERHQILQWYKDLCDFQRSNKTSKAKIHTAIASGPVWAYLSLSYDLYLLRHHSALHERLISRLKDKHQFQGARYEVYVAASFIKAGFEIEFEDESDRSRSHCEFVATYKGSGVKFSIEAKSRHRQGVLGQKGKNKAPEDVKLRIGTLLRQALRKQASHPRIIFIDVNMPPEEAKFFNTTWLKPLEKAVSQVETEKIDGKPVPGAYLFSTNHPYHYVGNEKPVPSRDLFFTAINIPVFLETNKENIEEKTEKIKKDIPEVLQIWHSLTSHHFIPDEYY
ncbi:MAG: hypothetical protein DHS20C13_20660 [Thermodesulfobacteriota bacterium]|nr:MAG: hypothetical protein DHS20C13_20660 [Thermodesulfobacteriota bacterium]